MKKFIVTAALSAFCACAYAQTDSIGIYKVDNAGISRIEAARPAQTKISGGLKSKAKVVFNGASSQNRFSGSATFRLYFGTPSPYDAAKYFMFTPSYSVKDFSVGIVPLVAVWRGSICRKSLITTDNKTAFSKSSAQKICR